MNNVDAEDLRSKTIDELVKLIIDLRKEQFNIRFQKVQGALENTVQVRINRRTIARAKTILNQKRMEEKAAQDNKQDNKKVIKESATQKASSKKKEASGKKKVA